jgi:hypothetical protein
MTDITNTKLILFKGFLFLAVGLLSSVLIILEHPTLKVALLLIIAIWSFARFYYFSFYVIEHYVDSSYKFSGLWSFAQYLYKRKKRWQEDWAITDKYLGRSPNFSLAIPKLKLGLLLWNTIEKIPKKIGWLELHRTDHFQNDNQWHRRTW